MYVDTHTQILSLIHKDNSRYKPSHTHTHIDTAILTESHTHSHVNTFLYVVADTYMHACSQRHTSAHMAMERHTCSQSYTATQSLRCTCIHVVIHTATQFKHTHTHINIFTLIVPDTHTSSKRIESKNQFTLVQVLELMPSSVIICPL